MPLLGTLSTMPLPDLLRWIGTARKTGTLQIERNKVFKWIVFQEGRVGGCSSDDPPGRLGHFLLSRGKITDDQLREALKRQESQKQHLGMILVGMGALSEDDLKQHLTAKSEETVYSIFDWDDAMFRFEEGVTSVSHVMPVSIQVEDLLLRGLRRYDEMRQIRRVFDDPGIVLRQTPKMPPPEVFHNRLARNIYESITGERTVAEILLITHGSEYLVTKFLFELHRNGFVEKTATRSIEPAQPAPDADSDVPPLPSAAADLDVATPTANGEPAAESEVETSAEETTSPPAPTVEEPPTEVVLDFDPDMVDLEPDDADAPPVEAAPTDEPTPKLWRANPSPDPVPRGVTERKKGFELELATARHLMQRSEFEGALQILDDAYQSHPQDESLRRLTAEAEAAFIDKAYRHYLPGNHVPVLAKPVESLETENLSPTEFYLLSRIDGAWDVRSIILVSPLREVEALRTLKRMRESGILELKDPNAEDQAI
jgi:hypothetical protein